MLYAIAVDVTKVDSREAWWNQSTLHNMAQSPGRWGQGAVGGVNKVSTARCTESWWGEGAVHGMAQLPCSIVEHP